MIHDQSNNEISQYYPKVEYDYQEHTINFIMNNTAMLTLKIGRFGENNQYGILFAEVGSDTIYTTNLEAVRSIIGTFKNDITGNYFIFNEENNANGNFEYWEDGMKANILGVDASYVLYNGTIYYDFSNYVGKRTMEYDGNKIIYNGEEYIRQ